MLQFAISFSFLPSHPSSFNFIFWICKTLTCFQKPKLNQKKCQSLRYLFYLVIPYISWRFSWLSFWYFFLILILYIYVLHFLFFLTQKIAYCIFSFALWFCEFFSFFLRSLSSFLLLFLPPFLPSSLFLFFFSLLLNQFAMLGQFGGFLQWIAFYICISISLDISLGYSLRNGNAGLRVNVLWSVLVTKFLSDGMSHQHSQLQNVCEAYELLPIWWMRNGISV